MSTLAIFIDAENVGTNEFTQIQSHIDKLGDIILYNIYADWSDLSVRKWLILSREHGINQIQCEKISGKNSVDLKLTVDIMSTLFNNDKIDIFVIVSTDSDFRHVIREIKVKNKKAICIGYDSANVSLKSICNQYIDISLSKKLTETVPIEDNVSKRNKNLNSKKVNIDTKYATYVKDFLSIHKTTTVGKIKNVIKNIEPNFDFKIYGFSRISDFLKYILIDDHNILIEGNNISVL